MKTWNDLIRRMCAQLLLAAAVLVFAAPPAGAQDQRVRSDQEILMQLERDWDAAFLTRDVRVIDSILAEEFIATYDDGSRGDRAKELSLAAEFNQNIESSVLKEFTVKIYGDTAVVWFTRKSLPVAVPSLLKMRARTSMPFPAGSLD